jgi:predicted O-methyltransferase YrrM
VTAAEPVDEREARDWTARHLKERDPFYDIYAATERHRIEHRCEAYASSNGSLLAVLARAIGARRALEVGTALGYTAAWLAHAMPDGHVDTVEADPAHADLALRQLVRARVAERVRIRVGRSPGILAGLTPGYDLIFYDASVPTPEEIATFRELLRPGGLLVTSNLFLGVYDPAMSGLERGAETRRQLLDPTKWLTTFADLKALSVRLS